MIKDGSFERCNRECKKYGFTCSEEYGFIIITTKFEKWKYKPTNGKTQLLHANTGMYLSSRKSDYHTELREYINEVQLVRYIYEHEVSKYSQNRIIFTVFTSKKDNFAKMN